MDVTLEPDTSPETIAALRALGEAALTHVLNTKEATVSIHNPREVQLSQRSREDVALVAMTMAWCAGLRWAELPYSAPDGQPWEHDRQAFLQTALVILGYRDVHVRDVLPEEVAP